MEVKKLGFGLMRLPRLENEEIDIEQTKQMVDMFLEAGFNYFDTAWAYKGSEDAIRQALVERYPRDKFFLASKNAAWINCKTKEDAINQFETSLKQAGVDYFDYYLLHNLGNERTKYFDDFDLWNWGKEMKKEGKIKNLGFSFHSTPEELEEILSKHSDVDFIQLQINYADWDNPVIESRKCYEIARKYDKKVIVMEPVKGGLLANPPEPIKKVFDDYDNKLSYASWAIKYAANLDGVLVVLSGMSNIDQMKDNISYMKDFKHLSKEEEKVIKKAQEELSKIPTIPCTSCNYCAKVCPMNIGISASFKALNLYILYNDIEKAIREESWSIKDKKRADSCIGCGRCEEVCPQHINIREELERVKKIIIEKR